MKYYLQSVLNFKIKQHSCLAILVVFCALNLQYASAQGTWTAINTNAPDANGGGLVLLSDGTVLCKSASGGGDGIGNIYNRLTPDASGSYVNGIWSSIAPMHETRLYYSTQVLKDGRVYVAGGEYGTGGSAGEVYDPVTDNWKNTPAPGSFLSDANSEILEDGRVIQALVSGSLKGTKIYDPLTNSYSAGPSCVGIHNESAWTKLADNSILFVDRQSKKSERYIPSLNKWIADATLPVSIYDPYGLEQGGALLLPDGRAIFFGSTGHNAIYTPSGNESPGVWAAAADFPNKQGTPDAPAAMMVNGKILCAVSPVPTSGNHFPTPTSFYEYDYLTNTFTRVSAPGGGNTVNNSVYTTIFLNLPNGQVLYGIQGSTQYYVYMPDGSAIKQGKPSLKKWKSLNNGTYRITGTGFNGISEGATYGDDWQMNSNYPLVRLTSGTNVYYARTYNWNSTGLRRDTLNDTAYLTLPAGLPNGTYRVAVVANGIKSNSLKITIQDSLPVATKSLSIPADEAVANTSGIPGLKIYPNPASAATNITFSIPKTTHVSIVLNDAGGRLVQIISDGTRNAGMHSIQFATNKLARGAYFVKVITSTEVKNIKLVVE